MLTLVIETFAWTQKAHRIHHLPDLGITQFTPTVLKVWSDDLWQGVPETFPGDPQGENYLNNNTKMAFAVFTCSSMSIQWNFPEATWCDITAY